MQCVKARGALAAGSDSDNDWGEEEGLKAPAILVTARVVGVCVLAIVVPLFGRGWAVE